MKYEIVEKCEGKLPIHIVSNRSFNELENAEQLYNLLISKL